jgi:hypothetical protein
MTAHFDRRHTDVPTFRINPEVLEGIAPLPGIDRVKVEPAPSWVVSILQALAENRLRFELTFKSIAAYAEGPVAIAALMMMMAVLAVVVTAGATDHSPNRSFEPSRSFEQLWTTRVASEEQGGKEHE